MRTLSQQSSFNFPDNTKITKALLGMRLIHGSVFINFILYNKKQPDMGLFLFSKKSFII